MLRSLICLILLLAFNKGTAQSLEELQKRNGFKNIKLGMIVDSLQGIKLKKEFKEKEEYPAKLFTVEHPDYDRIGEVKVKSIEVKTYKDLIYDIEVITDKDPRLMKALESLYGKAAYDMKNKTYFWKTDSLILKFLSPDKNHLQLSYSSFDIYKMMKDDKNKKVDDIKNDF
jgi:hypothetical protein